MIRRTASEIKLRTTVTKFPPCCSFPQLWSGTTQLTEFSWKLNENIHITLLGYCWTPGNSLILFHTGK